MYNITLLHIVSSSGVARMCLYAEHAKLWPLCYYSQSRLVVVCPTLESQLIRTYALQWRPLSLGDLAWVCELFFLCSQSVGSRTDSSVIHFSKVFFVEGKESRSASRALRLQVGEGWVK